MIFKMMINEVNAGPGARGWEAGDEAGPSKQSGKNPRDGDSR